MPVDITTAVAFLIAVIATSRVVRLIADDDYPPVKWLREWYILRLTKGNGWAELITCGFCVAPWVALPNLLLAWASDLAWWWWVPNLWLAAAYLSSILNARDLPPEQR